MPINRQLRTACKALYTASTATTALPVDGSGPIPVVDTSEPTGTTGTVNGASAASPAIHCNEWSAIRFIFGGTDAADETVNYRVIAWSRGPGLWLPQVVASGTATLGATAMTVTGLDTAATLLADTITETLGLQGSLVRSPVANAVADLTVWPGSAQLLTVETDLGTAAAASVYWEGLDESASANVSASVNVNLGDVGVLNTSETAINPATSEAQGYDSGATFTRVKIDQTAAAGASVLIAALASNYTRLHALFGTMAAAGTLTIEDSAGADLSGPMPIGANGGLVIPFTRDKDGCIITAAVNKGISINTSQKFYGFAIVSQSTTA